jgi:MFS family permease
MMQTSNIETRLGFNAIFATVFLPFAFGHYVSFIFRSVNAVLAPYLVADLRLSAVQLGLISSAYFFSFALAQLPVGLALDRFGSKRVQLTLLGIAGVGSLLFAFGQDFTSLLVARILIGLGLSACFMSSIKAISYWIESRSLPSIHGYLLAVGGLGAMSSTLPVEWILHFINWRTLFVILAAITITVAVVILLLVPQDPVEHRILKWPTLRSLLEVYQDRAFRRTISLMLVPHTVAFGLQGLWLGQWLHDVGGLTTLQTARMLFIGMAAIVVGSLSVGRITEWAGRYGVKPIDVGGIGVALFVGIQCLAMMNIVPLLPALSICFTLVGTIAGLEYTIVAQSVPPALTGRAATCLNLLILFGAFLVQTGFGAILGAWGADGAHRYPPVAYQVAFGIAVLLQLPGLIRWAMTRKSEA